MTSSKVDLTQLDFRKKIIVTKIKTVGVVGRSINRKHGTVESPESSRWGSEQLIFDTGDKVIHRER